MERRRKRKRKKVGRRVLLLFLAAGLLGFFSSKTYKWAHRTSFFALKEVIVQGNLIIPQALLLEQSGITTGLNLFQIQGRDVRDRLLRIPRVKWVEVRRRWPGTLRVFVREKESIGFLNNTYEVMEDGELFLLSAEDQIQESRTAELPSLVGRDPDRLLEGVQEGVRLLRFLGDFPLDRIDVTDPENILLYLTPHQKVYLGRGDYEKKVAHLKRLVEELEERGEDYRTVDLRFTDQAVIRRS